MNLLNVSFLTANNNYATSQIKSCKQNCPTNVVKFRGNSDNRPLNSDFPISLEYFCKNYVDKNKKLGSGEKTSIQQKMDINNAKMKKLQDEQLELGRILDYDNMKAKGFNSSEIRKFVKEDDLAIKKAKNFTQTNILSKDYMFGYPANIATDSSMVSYLRNMETQLTLLNNCGDSYEVGNGKIDCKSDYEQPLLNKFFKYFGVDEEKTGIKPWGYVTGGGSESNRWGITNGLRKFPDARVYYSEGSHYSVEKSVTISPDVNGNSIDLIKHTAIPTEQTNEKIDADILTKEIEKNWKEKKEPAVLLLTWGTTKTGARDDVSKISKVLTEKQIPHYIHLDAALSGGMSKNQTNAPILPDMGSLGVDSVSVSLHKYFGSHEVKSVVIAKEEPLSNMVDYIGVKDSTTAGSRGFSPFSTMQRVVETLERKSPEEYSRNIDFFEKNLTEKEIPYTREPLSNTFVINKPSDEICKKYQLSVFKDKDGNDKSHIIIFPHHKEEIMEELTDDISKDMR